MYYLILAGLTKLSYLAGMVERQRIVLWQCFSLLCGTGVLVTGVWIARLVYPERARNRTCLLTVLAVAPPLVFTSSRINNDVLITLLDFLWLACLLQYWKKPASRTWIALSLVVAFALLTKASALVLLPISFFCLYLVVGPNRVAKIRAAAFLFGAVALISGWYYLARIWHATAVDKYLVGNLGGLPSKAHIHGVFLKSLVFNPWDILHHPIADPWGAGGDHFLEAFFKSIFLGEWLNPAYRWVARSVVLIALLLVPIFAWGVRLANRERRSCDVPLLIVLGMLFSAHWIFMQLAPYLSSTDFRYSSVLLVPFVVFFIKGSEELSPVWEEASRFILKLLVLNCAIYLLELALFA